MSITRRDRSRESFVFSLSFYFDQSARLLMRHCCVNQTGIKGFFKKFINKNTKKKRKRIKETRRLHSTHVRLWRVIETRTRRAIYEKLYANDALSSLVVFSCFQHHRRHHHSPNSGNYSNRFRNTSDNRSKIRGHSYL